jgi:hypothetical protein
VKARQDGLQTVLYKPFRADRLMEAVEQALRSAPAGRPAATSQAAGAATVPSNAAPVADAARGLGAGSNSHPREARRSDDGIENEPAARKPNEAAAHE